jgi:glucose-1-phosphate thymidylyltransferase
MAPLTRFTNKHLLPVYLRPMVEYALSTLLQLGLREVVVVTGRQHVGQVVDVLGSGAQYGDVDLTYRVQEGAGGIAEALALAERFAAGRRVVVALGDNLIDDDGLSGPVGEFASAEPSHATCFLAKVPDARSYGVATVEAGRVVRVVEKPEHTDSDLAVAGLYCFPEDVFRRIATLRPSARGELEVTDLNNLYVAEGRMRFHLLDRWFDAGEPAPWMRAQRYVEENADRFGPSRFRRPTGG